MSLDHDRARWLQARGDRLRELLDNPPNAEDLREGWGLPLSRLRAADWIDAVVAAHRSPQAGTDG